MSGSTPGLSVLSYNCTVSCMIIIIWLSVTTVSWYWSMRPWYSATPPQTPDNSGNRQSEGNQSSQCWPPVNKIFEGKCFVKQSQYPCFTLTGSFIFKDYSGERILHLLTQLLLLQTSWTVSSEDLCNQWDSWDSWFWLLHFSSDGKLKIVQFLSVLKCDKNTKFVFKEKNCFNTLLEK